LVQLRIAPQNPKTPPLIINSHLRFRGWGWMNGLGV